MVAVARSTLVIVWHVLSDPDTRFEDLGADHYDRHVSITAKKRRHIRELEALGYRVSLEPAACTTETIPAALRSAGELPPAWSPTFSD